jgi:arsenite methyltransferase
VTRPRYGLDAPPVVRNLALAAAGCAALAFALPAAHWLLWPTWVLGVEVLLMCWSSYVGKLIARDDLLDGLGLRGNERVLDVGCGRGLLLLGAAKRLPHGRAVGVDLWRRADQSGNRREATLVNAFAEGVADRVELHDGDARQLPFPDASFDAVVSSLVIHNIGDRTGRDQAVREIARVLKPGGQACVVDFRHTAEYASVLRDNGLPDAARSRLDFLIFPPVRVVTGSKHAGGVRPNGAH